MHTKHLQLKYNEHYNWFYPVPGDWHIMKTSAEVIKHILADGGFQLNVDTKKNNTMAGLS